MDRLTLPKNKSIRVRVRVNGYLAMNGKHIQLVPTSITTCSMPKVGYIRLGMKMTGTLESSFSSQLIWGMHVCSYYLPGRLSNLSRDLQRSVASWKFHLKVRRRAAAKEGPLGQARTFRSPPPPTVSVLCLNGTVRQLL